MSSKNSITRQLVFTKIFEINETNKIFEIKTAFVWLLLPSEKEMPKMEAEIISENDEEVQVEVKSENQPWQLTISFMNSEDAELIN